MDSFALKMRLLQSFPFRWVASVWALTVPRDAEFDRWEGYAPLGTSVPGDSSPQTRARSDTDGRL